MERPNDFHYDPVHKTWDNNFSPGTGVWREYDGWHWTSFIMGSLQRFGPVPTEEEARRRHKEDMDAEFNPEPGWQYEDDGDY